MMNNGAAYLSPLCGVLQVCLIYVAFGLLLNIRMIHKAVLNGQVWHCTFGVSCRFYSWVHEVVPPQSSIRWSGLLVLPKDNISLQWVNLVSHLVRRHTQKCQVIPVVIFTSLCRVWSERSRRKSAFLGEVILHVAQSLRICTIFHNGRNKDLGMGIQNFIPSIQSHRTSLLCNQPAKHRTSRFYTAPSAPEIRASLVERWSPGPPSGRSCEAGLKQRRAPTATFGYAPRDEARDSVKNTMGGEIWPAHYGSHWSGGLKFWHPMAQWLKFRASQREVTTPFDSWLHLSSRESLPVDPGYCPGFCHANTLIPLYQWYR